MVAERGQHPQPEPRAPWLIGAERVRFGPECFEVAPHDFEKLTISVSVPPDTPAGDYEVVFALGDSEPDLKMGFAVTAG